MAFKGRYALVQTPLSVKLFWFFVWLGIIVFSSLFFFVFGGIGFLWFLVQYGWSIIVWLFWNFFLVLKLIGVLIIGIFLFLVIIWVSKSSLKPIRFANRKSLSKSNGTTFLVRLPKISKTKKPYKPGILQRLKLDYFLEISGLILENCLAIIALTPIMFFEFKPHQLPLLKNNKVATWRPGCYLLPGITLGTFAILLISWQLALLFIGLLILVAAITAAMDY
jgi:hypothetical protein